MKRLLLVFFALTTALASDDPSCPAYPESHRFFDRGQELTSDGSSTGLTGTFSVPANGQVATFLNQIPGFAALSAPFQGVLRVSNTSSIAVVGLRARYNERRDFLASRTPPVNESSPPSTAPVYFPQIADGGGYTTQFILFSNKAAPSSGAIEVFSESGGVLNLTLR